jgi:hypothetical protein
MCLQGVSWRTVAVCNRATSFSLGPEVNEMVARLSPLQNGPGLLPS